MLQSCGEGIYSKRFQQIECILHVIASSSRLKKLLSPIEATLCISELCGLLLLQAWAHQEALLGTDESRHRARKLYQRCIEVNPDSVHAWQVTLTAVPSSPSLSFIVFVCEWLNMGPLCIDGRCEHFSENNYNIYEHTFE
jgi:hypothetical protein